jgi:hypothetical protein
MNHSVKAFELIGVHFSAVWVPLDATLEPDNVMPITRQRAEQRFADESMRTTHENLHLSFHILLEFFKTRCRMRS